MARIAITVLVILGVVMLALPLIARLVPDEGDGAANIPSKNEAPPQWDEESLVGTAWKADMSKAKGEWKTKLIFIYSFNRPGRVALRTIDTEAKPESEMSDEEKIVTDTLTDAFLPDEKGSYEVRDGTLQIDITMLGIERTDTIEIRGKKLYYHGVPMKKAEPFEPEA